MFSLRMGPAAGHCAITPSLFTTAPHQRRHSRESGNPDLSPGSFYREVGRSTRHGAGTHFLDRRPAAASRNGLAQREIWTPVFTGVTYSSFSWRD